MFAKKIRLEITFETDSFLLILVISIIIQIVLIILIILRLNRWLLLRILLILLKVFLMEKKPGILFIDEPEISLHVSWQQQLIEAIRTLNSRCQIILATHSPGIFAKGWINSLVYMEDLVM